MRIGFIGLGDNGRGCITKLNTWWSSIDGL